MLQPSEMLPPDIRTSSLPDWGSGPLLALRADTVAPPASWIVAPGNVALESSAATEMVRELEAGVPVMYALGPSLPLDATTTAPARDAFSAATASGVLVVPKSEPSDMLMTSTPSWTALLI